MQNLNTRPATRKVGQSTEIVKLLRIQASDTHVVEFDNVDTRFNDCNNWQVMAGNASCTATACMSVFQM